MKAVWLVVAFFDGMFCLFYKFSDAKEKLRLLDICSFDGDIFSIDLYVDFFCFCAWILKDFFFNPRIQNLSGCGFELILFRIQCWPYSFQSVFFFQLYLWLFLLFKSFSWVFSEAAIIRLDFSDSLDLRSSFIHWFFLQPYGDALSSTSMIFSRICVYFFFPSPSCG